MRSLPHAETSVLTVTELANEVNLATLICPLGFFLKLPRNYFFGKLLLNSLKCFRKSFFNLLICVNHD